MIYFSNEKQNIINGDLAVDTQLFGFIWDKTLGDASKKYTDLHFLCDFPPNHSYLFQCRSCSVIIYVSEKENIAYSMEKKNNFGCHTYGGIFAIQECS